jgi:hypothetical protein
MENKTKHTKDKNPVIQSMLNHLAEETVSPEKIDLWADIRNHLAASKTQSKRKEFSMNKRIMLSASTAVLILALVAVFIARNVTTVSAQTILERASAVQSATKPAQGISHTVIEIYENPLALAGERPGKTTINETYYSLSTLQGQSAPKAAPTFLYRNVTKDTAGNILDVSASDGSFNYSNYSANSNVTPTTDGPLTIYRSPLSQDDMTKNAIRNNEPSVSANSLFEWFRDNPRVELEGKVTWTDGSLAYVLVDRNEQTKKLANGQVEKTSTGMTKMIFNAQTYQLLESQTSVRKDEQDIIISEDKFVVDEILPADTPVDWSLSDLKNVTFVDETVTEDPNYTPESTVLSEHELATHINAYVLKTIPEGFSLKIIMTPNDPQGQSYNYEINYENSANETFGMMAVGTMDPGFIEKSFYDGSYKTASGLTINYSPSSSHGTNGMLTIPDGTSFLLSSSMSREEVQKLAEDLVPAK